MATRQVAWGCMALGAVHALLELYFELAVLADHHQLIISDCDQIKKELWQDINTSLFGFTAACQPALLPGAHVHHERFMTFSICHSQAAKQPSPERVPQILFRLLSCVPLSPVCSSHMLHM